MLEHSHDDTRREQAKTGEKTPGLDLATCVRDDSHLCQNADDEHRHAGDDEDARTLTAAIASHRRTLEKECKSRSDPREPKKRSADEATEQETRDQSQKPVVEPPTSHALVRELQNASVRVHDFPSFNC